MMMNMMTLLTTPFMTTKRGGLIRESRDNFDDLRRKIYHGRNEYTDLSTWLTLLIFFACFQYVMVIMVMMVMMVMIVMVMWRMPKF